MPSVRRASCRMAWMSRWLRFMVATLAHRRAKDKPFGPVDGKSRGYLAHGTNVGGTFEGVERSDLARAGTQTGRLLNASGRRWHSGRQAMCQALRPIFQERRALRPTRAVLCQRPWVPCQRRRLQGDERRVFGHSGGVVCTGSRIVCPRSGVEVSGRKGLCLPRRVACAAREVVCLVRRVACPAREVMCLVRRVASLAREVMCLVRWVTCLTRSGRGAFRGLRLRTRREWFRHPALRRAAQRSLPRR
jgi:hypothetical protein